MEAGGQRQIGVRPHAERQRTRGGTHLARDHRELSAGGWQRTRSRSPAALHGSRAHYREKILNISNSGLPRVSWHTKLASVVANLMSRVWQTIRGYFLWTYDRGGVHYDVMVSLILAFVFLAPHWINF